MVMHAYQGLKYVSKARPYPFPPWRVAQGCLWRAKQHSIGKFPRPPAARYVSSTSDVLYSTSPLPGFRAQCGFQSTEQRRCPLAVGLF